MLSMSKALTGLSIIISLLAIVCVGPAVAQQPNQKTLGGGGKNESSGEQEAAAAVASGD
jgi:hypothetical protein